MAGSHPKSRVLTIGGKRWLAGMTWRCYDKPLDRSHIRKDAKALEAEVYTQRSGTVRTPIGVEPRYDAGYARADRETSRGKVYSLAAALAGTKPGPWTGIFKLGEGEFYYLQVTADGAVLPDQYGELIGDATEIEGARALHGVSSETTLIEGDLKEIERLLSGLIHEAPVVRPVTRRVRLKPKHVLIIGVSAVALLSVRYGYEWYQAQILQREQAARMAALAREKAAVRPPSPLKLLPHPGPWLLACSPARWALPSNEYGWSLNAYACLPTEVVLTWVRGAGANSVQRPAGSLDSTGNVVTRKIPLPSFDKKTAAAKREEKGHYTVVPPLSGERAQLEAWGETSGISVQLGEVSEVPKMSLRQCAVRIQSPLVPWELTSLNAIPGLRLTDLRSAPNGTWTIEGIVYGR